MAIMAWRKPWQKNEKRSGSVSAKNRKASMAYRISRGVSIRHGVSNKISSSKHQNVIISVNNDARQRRKQRNSGIGENMASTASAAASTKHESNR